MAKLKRFDGGSPNNKHRERRREDYDEFESKTRRSHKHERFSNETKRSSRTRDYYLDENEDI